MSEDETSRGTLRRRALPAALALLLLVAGFAALDDYNVTWDEALGDLFFGERYLSFFTTLDPVYLDFEADPYPPERTPDLGVSPFRIRPWEYYPVASTLAAATSALLSRGLGLLDPFDGFHALNLLLGALFVGVFYRFLECRLGWRAALAAAVLLFTAPRVGTHMMANVKDFPEMVFFGLAALAFLAAYERGSVAGLLGAGAVWGLALGTKANALFLPAIPLAVVLVAETPEPWRGRKRALVLALLGAAAVGAALVFALWPYLWGDPVERVLQHLEYIALRSGYARAESLAPPLPMVLLTTPPVFLGLAALGLVPAVRRAFSRDRLALFFLAWIAVVLGRFLLPGAVNFDGVRHFLELFPALAAVAGMVVAWLASSAEGLAARRSVVTALLLALLLPGAWAMLRTHPFQIAYWNAFAGGLAGARERGLPQAGDYWGTSYRLGLRWVNENAPEGALLAVPVVEHAVRLVAPVRLRPDVTLLPVTTPYTPRIAPERLRLTRAAARERPLYVMFVHRADWMNELMRDCLLHLEPEAEWTLDGVSVLSIYRYPGTLVRTLTPRPAPGPGASPPPPP